MPYAPPEDIDPAVRELIRHKARRMTGWQEFAHADREDIEQELAMHVLAKQSLYDPSRASPATFYARVLDNKATDLRRAAAADKRGQPRTRRAEHFDGIAAADIRGRTDLRIDVAERASRLEPGLHELSAALVAGGVAGAGRTTGHTRGRVRQGCHKLAAHFHSLAPEHRGGRRPAKNNSLTATIP